MLLINTVMHLNGATMSYLERKVIVKSIAYAAFASIGFFLSNYFLPVINPSNSELFKLKELIGATIIGFFLSLTFFILVLGSLKWLERKQ